jgi:hypothetical protein
MLTYPEMNDIPTAPYNAIANTSPGSILCDSYTTVDFKLYK